MKQNQILRSLFVFVVSLLLTVPSYAGNGNGNNGNGNGNGGPAASLPINEGILFLLIAGTVIGITVMKKTASKKVEA
ncbi:MAG: hypothetical protein JWQ25_1698 [Daejeonella sp.]|nr:hypothetical protein [Daejeonella sp.]